ncbi:MAG: type II secretion system protein M [Rhodocyclaceae bacterium]|nr:type II secretion system protein M [Rhodocyclaceae bacterium]
MRIQPVKMWQSRSPRERTVIAVLAAIVGVVFYVWLVQSAAQARAQLRSSVTVLRAQVLRLDQQALEYGRLRTMPAATASAVDLRLLMQARIDDAGLARSLLSLDAPSTNQVKVVFGALSFSDWLTWTASLQAQHVRLDTCRIEALSAPGLVSVTATFTRAGS